MDLLGWEMLNLVNGLIPILKHQTNTELHIIKILSHTCHSTIGDSIMSHIRFSRRGLLKKDIMYVMTVQPKKILTVPISLS